MMKYQQWIMKVHGVFYYLAGLLLIGPWIWAWFYADPAPFRELHPFAWFIWIIGMILIFYPIVIFPRKGQTEHGRDFTRTTKLVKSGLYSVIRHPLYLGWILMHLVAILFFQHWVVIILEGIGMVCVYFIAIQEETTLIEKFGEEYVEYMKKVPRFNLLIGIIRKICYKNG